MNASNTNAFDDGWGMTCAFWGTLLAAGGLFATVALAPKLQELSDLKSRYADNQHRLVALEQQATELERIAAAIETDPAFASELAKFEFISSRRGDESIAVAHELRLGGDRETADAPQRSSATDRRWAIPQTILTPLATSDTIRFTLLVAAALLAVFALVALNDAHAALMRHMVRGVGQTSQKLLQRYQRL